MSWRFVYHTDLRPFAFKDRDDAAAQIALTGYRFFTWNDYVYFIHDGNAVETGIKVEDLY
jgi:hypothetical protein